MHGPDHRARPVAVPTAGGVEADIRWTALRRIDSAAFAAIERAWTQYSVLLCHGRTLTDPDLIAASRRFGGLNFAPVQETGRRSVEGLAEICVVSNVIANGQPIRSLGGGEA